MIVISCRLLDIVIREAHGIHILNKLLFMFAINFRRTLPGRNQNARPVHSKLFFLKYFISGLLACLTPTAHAQMIDANGNGMLDAGRLYQLIRLAHPGQEHTVQIEFQEAGVEAFAFTFG